MLSPAVDLQADELEAFREVSCLTIARKRVWLNRRVTFCMEAWLTDYTSCASLYRMVNGVRSVSVSLLSAFELGSSVGYFSLLSTERASCIVVRASGGFFWLFIHRVWVVRPIRPGAFQGKRRPSPIHPGVYLAAATPVTSCNCPTRTSRSGKLVGLNVRGRATLVNNTLRTIQLRAFTTVP